MVIHFQPLEKYPPAMNLLTFLTKQNNGKISVHVITTRNSTEKKLFEMAGLQIHRLGQSTFNMNRIKRMFTYIFFNLSALWLLIRLRPAKVMYYETLSAGAPLIYKKYLYRNAELYVHFHEYTSPIEYRDGMLLSKYLNKLERRNLKLARWISHTNETRLDLFYKDFPNLSRTLGHTLANYPPESWKTPLQKSDPLSSYPIKFVYVGALGLDTMYVKEWATFVKSMNGRITWDIYSDNFSPDVLEWLNQLHAPDIFFKGHIQYEDLPQVLPDYNAGLILYKGHIPNYIYNAPNKLFEYYACGLDVWFPPGMTGCVPFQTTNTYPKIIAIDFTKLNVHAFEEALDRTYAQPKPSSFYCENNLHELTNKLLDIAR